MNKIEKQEVDTAQNFQLQVVETGERSRQGWNICRIEEDLQFNTHGLESYFFAGWKEVVYDAMLVAATAEYCDRRRVRSSATWQREFRLNIPVHDPDHWNRKEVKDSLQDTLNFLTGDVWVITFRQRKKAVPRPTQGVFELGSVVEAVIPYSDGLDSFIVASSMTKKLGDGLVRVRVGSNVSGGKVLSKREPFMTVPFRVEAPKKNAEPSFRTRGFKFMILSGLSAYLANAVRVIVPESGIGGIGPALVPLAHAHPDYRNHPLFARRLERFLKSLLGAKITFEFPQLWLTKGQSLAQWNQDAGGTTLAWQSTRSCWQGSRHASVQGKARQCGICAACLLRRLSVKSAAMEEPCTAYMWENLSANEFEMGAAEGLEGSKKTKAMREYAIAATRHLEDLAKFSSSRLNRPTLMQAVFDLSEACDLSQEETELRLRRLLARHEEEWSFFVSSLGNSSFVAKWATRTDE